MVLISIMKKYVRKCPNCDKEIVYNYRQSFCKARKLNPWCKQCRAKERSKDSESKKKLLRNLKIGYGKDNPFYGKKHSQKTIDLLRKNAKILRGKDNLSFGKSVYDWWIEKYGKEIADQKMYEYRKKQSIKSSGKNNSMYGKPSPQGSGNGWSGWYNGWYFRSLYELSYMIKVIERFNLKWESGEKKKYLISYVDWNGKQRNYFCDFVINGKYLIECKPKKLHSAISVRSKIKGAEKFCNKNGLKYKLVSPKKLTEEEIKDLYTSGKIKFLERYDKKYREKYFNREPAGRTRIR